MKVNAIYRLIPVLLLILGSGCSDEKALDYNPQSDTSDNFIQDTPYVESEQISSLPKPPTGLYNSNFDGQQAVAPLAINTESGSDYYIKVVNASTNQDTLTLYIHGGENIEVEVPLGNYEIRYASGSEWYGEQELFGSDTSFNKADELFNFVNDGYQVSGYTITLYKVIDGNLQTKTIDKNQF